MKKKGVFSLRSSAAIAAAALRLGGFSSATQAGSIALTGHDDDFHQSAAALAQISGMLTFVRAGSALPVLSFDHGIQLTNALTTLGITFTNVDPNLGVPSAALFDTSIYSAVIVASDASCVGCDNDATSSANLAAASSSFASFFNAGGGIVGLAGASNTNYYNFLPLSASNPGIVFDSFGFSQTAQGIIDGIGAVTGDFPHNFFAFPGAGTDPTFHADEVYNGSSSIGTLVNQPFTIATTGTVTCTGVSCVINAVPEPTTLALLGLGFVGLGWRSRRKPS
jgi:hypothetical protein